MTTFLPRPEGVPYDEYVKWINKAYMALRRANGQRTGEGETPIPPNPEPINMADEPPIYPEDHEEELGLPEDAKPADKEQP